VLVRTPLQAAYNHAGLLLAPLPAQERQHMSLTNDIRKAVIALGVPCERMQAGQRGKMHFASAGAADLITPLGALEVKRPDKADKPKAHQVKWHDDWERFGFRVAVVTGVRQAVTVVKAWKDSHDHEVEMGWR
jgi:hypothetical protein